MKDDDFRRGWYTFRVVYLTKNDETGVEFYTHFITDPKDLKSKIKYVEDIVLQSLYAKSITKLTYRAS